jgi:type I restriction enzyme S subunit
MKEYFLEELLQIKNGRDHKHLPEGMIPIYGSGGIMRYGNQSIYDEESILLPRKGTLSNIQFVNVPFWTVDTIYYSIVNKEKAIPLYLYHYLKQLDLSYLNSGTGVPSMTFGAYYGIKVNLPRLETQQKIANVLSDLDAKIELNNKINTELEAMAKTLYDYWFVQFDFPDANGKPYKSSCGKMVYNKELKREIPVGWEVKKIKDIAKTGSGATPLKSKKEFYENGDIPWINSGEVNAPFIISAKKFITTKGLKGSSAKLFPKRTILMAMYGATAGQVSLIDIEACTNQAVCGIIPNDYRLVPYVKFKLHQLYNYLISLSTGSARDNLSQDKIKELYIVIPQENIIDKFYKVSNSSFENILLNLKENQQLASLRDWLLPMLMNGQVSVGDVEVELGMVAEGRESYGK